MPVATVKQGHVATVYVHSNGPPTRLPLRRRLTLWPHHLAAPPPLTFFYHWSWPPPPGPGNPNTPNLAATTTTQWCGNTPFTAPCHLALLLRQATCLRHPWFTLCCLWDVSGLWIGNVVTLWPGKPNINGRWLIIRCELFMGQTAQPCMKSTLVITGMDWAHWPVSGG
jgi:hypothetical protein